MIDFLPRSSSSSSSDPRAPLLLLLLLYDCGGLVGRSGLSKRSTDVCFVSGSTSCTGISGMHVVLVVEIGLLDVSVVSDKSFDLKDDRDLSSIVGLLSLSRSRGRLEEYVLSVS